MKKRWLYILLVIVTFGLVFLTPLETNEVQQYDQLKSLAFGWPLDFVIQDQSSLTPPVYPIAVSISSPLEHPTRVLWIKFFFSWIILYTVVLLGLMFFNRRHLLM